MAKDPAFLFYSSDFLTGTMLMDDEQVGQYIRLMCLQHQKGHLTEKDMLKVCGTRDNHIFSKFVKDEDGLYYNERLEQEINKRKKYSESRRQNRNKVDNSNTCVYLIKDITNGLIKIGSSNNPQRRLIELKNQYRNDELVLVAYVKNVEQKLETELHNTYKQSNRINEWYELSDKEVKEIIDTHHMTLHMNNHMSGHINNHMYEHMENENENENEIINKDVKEEKKKKTTKAFVKPTIEEVRDYCFERNNIVDAERFYDFYESKGWQVGKNSMKDWKAAVRNWERSNSNAYQPTQKPKNTITRLQEMIEGGVFDE